MLERGVDEEILHLCKGEESRRVDDIDAEDLGETVVIEVERILESELAVTVAVHDASVLDDVDIFWRPARGDIADDYLLEQAPVAGEADKEGCRLVDMRGGWSVPFWY